MTLIDIFIVAAIPKRAASAPVFVPALMKLGAEPEAVLAAYRIGLPVLDVVGIVTEGDFLRQVETDTQPQRPRWAQFLLGPGRLAENYVRTSGLKLRTS